MTDSSEWSVAKTNFFLALLAFVWNSCVAWLGIGIATLIVWLSGPNDFVWNWGLALAVWGAVIAYGYLRLWADDGWERS